MMLAAITKTPELILDENEAKRMESSIKKISKHYPVAISQKNLDMLMLGATLAEIYGTRAVAIYARKSAPRSAPQVVNFNAAV